MSTRGLENRATKHNKQRVSEPQTIAAIATGASAAGIGIIRISGPQALDSARAVVPNLLKAPVPRQAYFSKFTDREGEILDEGLVIYFKGPHSFTAEDIVEIHAHGSQTLLSMLLANILSTPNVRLAEPGEFTRRAYLNGRIDLSKAEAVASIVAAESEAAVRASAQILAGALKKKIDEIRTPLLALFADVEASLDFPDEAEGAAENVTERLVPLIEATTKLHASVRSRAFLERGIRVVLYGPVNAGKSTLFNYWVGHERAIVDSEAGTTRDTIEARVCEKGHTLILVDTAGLRDEAGRIEKLGIGRTLEELGKCDIAVLLVTEASNEDSIREWEGLVAKDKRITVVGKSDASLGEGRVSGKTGAGVEALKAKIHEKLGFSALDGALYTSDLNIASMGRALEHLKTAAQAQKVSTLEVVAGELNFAHENLSRVLGESKVDTALLDEIFARFCIGK